VVWRDVWVSADWVRGRGVDMRLALSVGAGHPRVGGPECGAGGGGGGGAGRSR